MRLDKIIISAVMILCGCSSLDFFSYRENTGLLTIEKPEGYGSIKFGARLASSSTAGTDYMAVSGGEGQQVVLYKLTDEAKLDNLDSPWKRYPVNKDKDKVLPETGAGASLAGLPVFFNNGKRVEGVLAIGQPISNSVMLFRPFDDKQVAFKSSNKQTGFGRVVSAIRPGVLDQWSLAVASNNGFEVVSDGLKSKNKGETYYRTRTDPVSKIGGKENLVSALAGGWFGVVDQPDRLFVAATVSHDSDAGQVRIFGTDSADARAFSQIGCLTAADENGFGASLLAADMDGDGIDELLVGSSTENAVHIFNVQTVWDVSQATKGCLTLGEDIDPLSTLKPEEGEWDVTCEKDCAFGTALALGEIATDNDGPELAVGAPGADVEGSNKAGAVYIYRGFEFEAEDDGLTEVTGGKLVGQVMTSSPKSDNRFGKSVIIAPAGGRSELIVGAPGAGKAYVVFCTDVGEDIEKGADVTHDGDGKTVSTRCRL